MGRLGEAAGVEGFEFQHMVVKPTLAPGRKEVVVAFDGEVARMRAPIDIRVLDKPLYLLPVSYTHLDVYKRQAKVPVITDWK